MNDLNFLKEVLDFVEKTPELAGRNCSRGTVRYPIPFFGNIKSANVLTVGVNPSGGEFAPPRQQYWPVGMTIEELHERLKNYFADICPPHQWFDGWIESLHVLGARRSYANGTVAHADLSPRATTPMGRVQDVVLFQKMIETDIKFLFKILFESRNIKLIMTGGKVLSEKYIAQWIRNLAPSPLYLQPVRKGTGATSFYKFNGLGREVWLFSSGVGPRFREQLRKNVSANRDALNDILN